MNHILTELLAGYFLYAFGMVWLVFRYSSKDKFPTAVATLFIPFIAVTAVAIVVFEVLTMRAPEVKPCPMGLPVAEQAAEHHRVRLFGGLPEQPKVAIRWATMYEAVMEKQAAQLGKVALRARDLLYA